jgi:predicted MFS family arabinose efflux permease
MSGLLVFLFSLPDPAWTALWAAVVFGAALVWWELRVKQPFIDFHLLRANLPLTRTYIRFALITLCMYTVLYGLTEWMEAARAIHSAEAGLLLLPMNILSAVVVGPISRRNLIRGPLIVAAASSMIASAGMLFLTSGTPIVYILMITLIFGVTMGTTVSGNQTALYTQVTAEQIGTASGLFRTFGYIGSIASSAIIGMVFHTRVEDSGLHVIGMIMIAASAVTLLMTISDRKLQASAKATRETH